MAGTGGSPGVSIDKETITENKDGEIAVFKPANGVNSTISNFSLSVSTQDEVATTSLITVDVSDIDTLTFELELTCGATGTSNEWILNIDGSRAFFTKGIGSSPLTRIVEVDVSSKSSADVRMRCNGADFSDLSASMTVLNFEAPIRNEVDI